MVFVIEHSDGTLQHPVSKAALKHLFPNVSFPRDWHGYQNADLGIFPLIETPKPEHDLTHHNVQGEPVKQGNEYMMVWQTPIAKTDEEMHDAWQVRFRKAKNKAKDVIEERYPDWKQRNMTMRVLTLQNINPLTDDEQAELASISAAWDWIEAVRAESDALEQHLLSIGLVAARHYDYQSHAWPQ
jgi:hypothetical protein